jgi:ubiquinone/menaquinone biosynthesis C-methylase UbiE
VSTAAAETIGAAAALHARAAAAGRTGGHLAEWADAVTAETLRIAEAAPGTRVLDVAGGRGEPAVALARTARVTTVDLSEDALAEAAAHAAREGVTTLATRRADAHALPFAGGAFDLVTCSFGLTHFADPARALREMRRVLAPEGRAVLAAWGRPEANAMHAATYALLGIDAEGDVYRFAGEGVLRAALEAAGFAAVAEERRTVPLAWRGSAAELWEFLQGVSPPLAGVTEREGGRAVAALAGFASGGRVVLPVEVLFASAKPR